MCFGVVVVVAVARRAYPSQKVTAVVDGKVNSGTTNIMGGGGGGVAVQHRGALMPVQLSSNIIAEGSSCVCACDLPSSRVDFHPMPSLFFFSVLNLVVAVSFLVCIYSYRIVCGCCIVLFFCVSQAKPKRAASRKPRAYSVDSSDGSDSDSDSDQDSDAMEVWYGMIWSSSGVVNPPEEGRPRSLLSLRGHHRNIFCFLCFLSLRFFFSQVSLFCFFFVFSVRHTAV